MTGVRPVQEPIYFSRMRMLAYPEPAVCPVQAQPEVSAPSALSYPEVPAPCGPDSSVPQHVLSQPEVCAPPLGPVLPKPKVLHRVCWQPPTKLPEESHRLWQFPVKCRLSRGRWPELLVVCFWTHLLLRFRLGPGSVSQCFKLVDCLVLFSIYKWIHTFFLTDLLEQILLSAQWFADGLIQQWQDKVTQLLLTVGLLLWEWWPLGNY